MLVTIYKGGDPGSEERDVCPSPHSRSLENPTLWPAPLLSGTTFSFGAPKPGVSLRSSPRVIWAHRVGLPVSLHSYWAPCSQHLGCLVSPSGLWGQDLSFLQGLLPRDAKGRACDSLSQSPEVTGSYQRK